MTWGKQRSRYGASGFMEVWSWGEHGDAKQKGKQAIDRTSTALWISRVK